MINIISIENQAQQDFQQALHIAFWRKARAWLGKDCNELLSYRDVFEQLKGQPQIKRGNQAVLLEQIVGSAGRSNDFDLAFYPLRRALQNRWINVAKTKYIKGKVSPVLLYKVGDAYFVEDGNHRVSIARANGKPTIQAKVIEFDVSNLTPEPACRRLGYKLSK